MLGARGGWCANTFLVEPFSHDARTKGGLSTFLKQVIFNRSASKTFGVLHPVAALCVVCVTCTTYEETTPQQLFATHRLYITCPANDGKEGLNVS